MKHFNIIVSGKVQGVFYRQSTVEVANKLDVKGFVRNEMNGNVTIEAEGTEDQLQKLIEWCKKGPSRAMVSDVKVSEAEIINFSSFEIKK